MPIVSSSYEVGVPQADGRSYVVELHTDSNGDVYRIEYGPVLEIDYQAVMAERAKSIDMAITTPFEAAD